MFAMDSSDEELKVEVGFNERFKITMLGDSNVGKSSVLRSLIKQEFNPCIKNTVGALRHRNVTSEDTALIPLHGWLCFRIGLCGEDLRN